MPNFLLELKQNKAAALDQAGAILTKLEADKRSIMTPEERVSFNEAKQRASDIQLTIDDHESLAAVNTNIPNDSSRRRLEVRDNQTTKPWGYDLIGDACEAKTGETATERRKRLAFCAGDYLQEVRSGTLSRITSSPVDQRLLALNADFEKRAAAAGASEAVPSDGGFLVYPDFSQEILQLAHDTGVIHPLCRKLPMSEFTNAVKIPAIDESSRKDGFRWGGVQAFWQNEAQAFTGSKPTVALVEMVTKKLTALYYATDEILADARLLGAIVMQAFGEEFGFKLDDAVLNGVGAGQPLGILKAPCLVSVAKRGSQTATTFKYHNAIDMWARLWAPSRKNAIWLINQDVEPQFSDFNMQAVGDSGTATGGVPIYLPSGASVFGAASAAPMVNNVVVNGTGGTLLGRPVFVVEQCQTLGTQGDVMLFDPMQYLTIDKGDIQAAQSMHVRFLTDEQTFRWIYRTDMQPWFKKPITPYLGTNTLSMAIAVDTRT